MKVLIQKLVSVGADLSTRKTLKAALHVLGIKPENIDKLYIELKNSVNRGRFKAIPAKHKVLFIPQCLRNSKKCRAKLTPQGYVCGGCGSCKAFVIKKRAERLGYRVFIVPGGSLVSNIIKKSRPRAVMGIGCLKELVMAAEEVSIPAQGVELLRDGCIDTDVNLDAVFDVLK